MMFALFTSTDFRQKMLLTLSSKLRSLEKRHAEMKESLKEQKEQHGKLKVSQEVTVAMLERADNEKSDERRQAVAACAQLEALKQHHETTLTLTEDKLSETTEQLSEAERKVTELKAGKEEAEAQCAQAKGELESMRASLKVVLLLMH
jgi:chromosome segregation ATPase